MAHYAQLDENNIVTQVIVVHNNELVSSKQTTVNEDGSVSVSVVESEENGIQFCKSLFGTDTNWIQTSYNSSFRGKYAGIGDTYDAVNNVFVSPVVESVPVATSVEESVPVVEATQAQVDLTSTALPAITSADIPALTSEQISGL